MNQEIDYESVIADLEARRAAFNQVIDQTIRSIRTMLALTAGGRIRMPVPEQTVLLSGVQAVATAGVITPTSSPQKRRDYSNLSLVVAAKESLHARNGQTNKDLAEALEMHGFRHSSKNFPNTLGSVLWRAMKNGDAELSRRGKRWYVKIEELRLSDH